MKTSAFSKAFLPFVLVSATALSLSGCGGGTQPPAETPRSVTGSTNLTGLWRVISKVGTTTQRTAATFVDSGANVAMNDCGLGFRNYALTRTGNALKGYYFNLADILVVGNDSLTYNYNNIDRDFEKMDKDAVYDMGNFSLSSAAFPTVNATSDVCVGFTDNGTEEGLILSTRVNGEMLRITINLTNSLRTGSFAIEPFGNAPATVTLDGAPLQTMIGADSAAVLQGTLTITKRGTVWVEGTVTGTLDDETTNISVSFKAETP
ncbi:MAG TPA: hypothetical protein VM553_21620 [Dongiaceae bacterium]|nr:hypothetical protein [Dongiaceae bacterium]